MKHTVWLTAWTLAALTGAALANGGPFFIDYPQGDPAEKGDLALVDRDLLPIEDSRLELRRETLHVDLWGDRPLTSPANREKKGPALFPVSVQVDYLFHNPADEPLVVDFAFPILRAVTTNPTAMIPTPNLQVTSGENVKFAYDFLQEPKLYGHLRYRCRRLIDGWIAARPEVQRRVEAVRNAADTGATQAAQEELAAWLQAQEGWPERTARLLGHWAAARLEPEPLLNAYLQMSPAQFWPTVPAEVRQLVNLADYGFGGWNQNPAVLVMACTNLGDLRTLGLQKATQVFEVLAAQVDPERAPSYEKLFQAWSGETRERAIDLASGQVRLREVDLGDNERSTEYGRVDYLDPRGLTPEQTERLQEVLQCLPVTFSFTPMNLVRYRVVFLPHRDLPLTVQYQQMAFLDTRDAPSGQFTYVLNSGKYWRNFGGLDVEITVPHGAKLTSFPACQPAGTRTMEHWDPHGQSVKAERDVYQAHVAQLDGSNLFAALPLAAPPQAQQQAQAQVQAKR